MSSVREREAAGPGNGIVRKSRAWPCQRGWSAGKAGP